MDRMGIRSRRAVALVTVLFLLVAGGLLAFYLTNTRREVTTSSQAAYEAYRAGIENVRRFYRKEARADFGRALSSTPTSPWRCSASPTSPAATSTSRGRVRAKLRNRLNEWEQLWVDFYSLGRRGHAKTAQAGRDDPREVSQRRRRRPGAGALRDDPGQGGGGDPDGDGLSPGTRTTRTYNQCGYYYALRGEREGHREHQEIPVHGSRQANPYDSLGEIQPTRAITTSRSPT